MSVWVYNRMVRGKK